MVDVQTDVEIQRPRTVVAACASILDSATSWYQNIKSVRVEASRPLAVGSQIAFVAQFLGRQLAYTYEVREIVPTSASCKSTSDGPFPMETTYIWADTPVGGNPHDSSQPGGTDQVSKVAAPMIASAMREQIARTSLG